MKCMNIENLTCILACALKIKITTLKSDPEPFGVIRLDVTLFRISKPLFHGTESLRHQYQSALYLLLKTCQILLSKTNRRDSEISIFVLNRMSMSLTLKNLLK
jgi:hypothetical protein